MSEYECRVVKTNSSRNMTEETLKIISKSGTKLVKVTNDVRTAEINEMGLMTKNERVLETETIDKENDK